MTKERRALLIDAKNREVREVTVGGLDDIYLAMSVEMIEVGFEWQNHDTLYVDEEGLYSNGRDWFYIEGAHQPFKGNGLVVGFNPKTGDSPDAKMTIEELKGQIRWMDTNTVGLLVQTGAFKEAQAGRA